MPSVADNLIKSGVGVFVDFDSSSTGHTGQTCVAYAQSYSLSVDGETVEVTSLCDDDADWANPEVQKKSWTLSTDALVIRDSYASGTTEGGQQDFFDALAEDETVIVAIRDANASKLSDYFWGYAIVTSFQMNGTAGEFHTYSVTLTGKGRLYRGV